MSNQLMRLDGYMTLAADGYSDPIALGRNKNLAVQCDVSTSSALDGYLSFELSNNRTNWCDDGSAVHVQAAGNYMLELADDAAAYARIKWNSDSGQGSMNMYVNKK
jgi:hypothetical protein